MGAENEKGARWPPANTPGSIGNAAGFSPVVSTTTQSKTLEFRLSSTLCSPPFWIFSLMRPRVGP